MTIAAKDILNKVAEVYKMAGDMEDFFYENMVVSRVDRENILYDIHRDCKYLEDKLLLRFAQGFAKLEQRESNK